MASALQYVRAGAGSVGAIIIRKGERVMDKKYEVEALECESSNEEALVLEEIQVEELAIDGICGVY